MVRIALAIIALAAAGFVTYQFYTAESQSIQFSAVKDIVFLGVSTLISYMVAKTLSRQEYERELHRLGNITSRRIAKLASNLRQIAQEVNGTDRRASSAIYRLSEDADESTSDILLITSTDKLPENADIVYCPECGTRDTYIFKPGKPTDSLVCVGCSTKYHVHKKSNGVLTRHAVQPSRNTEFPAEKSLERPMQPTQPDTDRVQLRCPGKQGGNACTNTLSFPVRNGTRMVTCFECDEQISYDFASRMIVKNEKAPPLPTNFVGTGTSAFADCPTCSNKIEASTFRFRNTKDDRFAMCDACKTRVVVRK